MYTISRVSSLIVCVFALIFFLASFGIGTNVTPLVQALTIADPERDLRELAVGEHTISFRIANASSLPLRVIGMSEA